MKGAHMLGLLHCPHSSYVIALPMPTLAGGGVWFLNAYGSPSKVKYLEDFGNGDI